MDWEIIIQTTYRVIYGASSLTLLDAQHGSCLIRVASRLLLKNEVLPVNHLMSF